MKKLLILFICILISISLVSCAETYNENVVNKAIAALKDEWREQYEKETKNDGYFEIKNTRIIEIKDNNVSAFDGIEYIIEFILYTDYYGSAPYYSEASTMNTVLIYENGETEVSANIFRHYSAATYSYDYSDLIENIYDCGSKYNVIEKLK